MRDNYGDLNPIIEGWHEKKIAKWVILNWWRIIKGVYLESMNKIIFLLCIELIKLIGGG